MIIGIIIYYLLIYSPIFFFNQSWYAWYPCRVVGSSWRRKGDTVAQTQGTAHQTKQVDQTQDTAIQTKQNTVVQSHMFMVQQPTKPNVVTQTRSTANQEQQHRLMVLPTKPNSVVQGYGASTAYKTKPCIVTQTHGACNQIFQIYFLFHNPSQLSFIDFWWLPPPQKKTKNWIGSSCEVSNIY